MYRLGHLRLIAVAGCLHAAPVPADPPVGVMRRPGEVPPPPTPVVDNLPHVFEPEQVAPVPAAHEQYPVQPWFPSVSGGPIVVSWIGTKVGFQPGVVVPYAPLLTVRAALDLAGVPPGRHRVDLIRDKQVYQLPFAAIVAGTQPDPLLAPGDSITLFVE